MIRRLLASFKAPAIADAEAIDRREFTRRLFAIGAGIAVGGELIRQVPLYDGLAMRRTIGPVHHAMTPDELDRLMKAIYSEPLISQIVYEDKMFAAFAEARSPGRQVRFIEIVSPDGMNWTRG